MSMAMSSTQYQPAMFAGEDRTQRMPFMPATCDMCATCAMGMAFASAAASAIIIETGVMTPVSLFVLALLVSLILLVALVVLLSLSGLTGLISRLVGLTGIDPGTAQGD